MCCKGNIFGTAKIALKIKPIDGNKISVAGKMKIKGASLNKKVQNQMDIFLNFYSRLS